MTSDEALYERLIEGDMSAFDALYGRYERRLFGFIRRYVPEVAEAEEIFHEAFLAVLRERHERHAMASFKSWLYRVTRNLCLNRLRARDRAARAMVAMASEPAAAGDGPAASLERAEVEAALRRAVARLPGPMSELYTLRAMGMSYEGVAEVLGVPVGTVKSRVHAMLKLLREEMSA